jgi:hypothetical protein
MTPTVTLAVVVPAEFAAVSVYVVVAEGVTDTELPLTAPTPWLIERDEAPCVANESVALCPATTAVGLAVKELMTGLDCTAESSKTTSTQ